MPIVGESAVIAIFRHRDDSVTAHRIDRSLHTARARAPVAAHTIAIVALLPANQHRIAAIRPARHARRGTHPSPLDGAIAAALISGERVAVVAALPPQNEAARAVAQQARSFLRLHR